MNNHFSNQTILDSTLMSSLVYLEGQYNYKIKHLNEEIFEKFNFEDFLSDKQVLDNANNRQHLENLFKSYLSTLENDEIYGKLVQERKNFYIDFAEDLQLDLHNQTYLWASAKSDTILDIKKSFFSYLNSHYPHKDIKEKLVEVSKVKTYVDILESVNDDKIILTEDSKAFLSKFVPLHFEEQIITKYQLYNPKNDNDIEAVFQHGYVFAGKKDSVKDACLFTGYVQENGEEKLYISFRGTEKRVKSAAEYFVQNYPNMERQYNYYEPILQEIIERESLKLQKSYPGKKLQVVFTGHSLGASLAEKALDKFKDSEHVSYQGVFVSNPGSFHYLQNVVNKLDQWDHEAERLHQNNNNHYSKMKDLGYHAVKKTIKAFKVCALFAVGACNTLKGMGKEGYKRRDHGIVPELLINGSTLGISKFLGFGLEGVLQGIGYLSGFVFSPLVTHKVADIRGLTINHERDNVPQVGKALFQNVNPQHVNLHALLPSIEEQLNPIKRIAHFEYHGREHYFSELKKMSSHTQIFPLKDKKDIVKNIADMTHKNSPTLKTTKNVTIDKMNKLRENSSDHSQKNKKYES